MDVVATRVRLEDIIEALEIESEEYLSFLNLDTGEVATVGRTLFSEAEEYGEESEEQPELPEWQQDEWETARQIARSDRFVSLPTKHDFHEWAVMNEFSLGQGSEAIRRELLDAIHGAGAFRHFKSLIRRLEIEQAWFEYRDSALKRMAIEWCEELGLDWQESRRGASPA
jgi:hypothetical protein